MPQSTPAILELGIPLNYPTLMTFGQHNGNCRLIVYALSSLPIRGIFSPDTHYSRVHLLQKVKCLCKSFGEYFSQLRWLLLEKPSLVSSLKLFKREHLKWNMDTCHNQHLPFWNCPKFITFGQNNWDAWLYAFSLCYLSFGNNQGISLGYLLFKSTPFAEVRVSLLILLWKFSLRLRCLLLEKPSQNIRNIPSNLLVVSHVSKTKEKVKSVDCWGIYTQGFVCAIFPNWENT